MLFGIGVGLEAEAVAGPDECVADDGAAQENCAGSERLVAARLQGAFEEWPGLADQDSAGKGDGDHGEGEQAGEFCGEGCADE